MSAVADQSNHDQHSNDEHPTDEEQVETEWHIWLLAIFAAGGVILLIFPPDILPQAGFALLGLAIAGWLIKTVIEGEL